MKDLKIIFMGNPAFAVPSLRLIYKNEYSIEAVVTNPSKRIGRGDNFQLTAVGQEAKTLDLKLLQPFDLREPNLLDEISSLNPDVFIVVAYKILPAALIAIPKLGSINLHPSLLPAYRGAAPIQWALINGETSTGITTFMIEKRVDSGNILMQEKMFIDPDDDYGSLAERMSEAGAKLILNTINGIQDRSIDKIPQDASAVTYAPKIKKSDCQINWDDPAEKIHNLIRALSPQPGAFSHVKNKRYKLYKTKILEPHASKLLPGTVVNRTDSNLWVQTGTGLLAIDEIQAEGKNKLNAENFLRGSKINTGDQFE